MRLVAVGAGAAEPSTRLWKPIRPIYPRTRTPRHALSLAEIEEHAEQYDAAKSSSLLKRVTALSSALYLGDEIKRGERYAKFATDFGFLTKVEGEEWIETWDQEIVALHCFLELQKFTESRDRDRLVELLERGFPPLPPSIVFPEVSKRLLAEIKNQTFIAELERVAQDLARKKQEWDNKWIVIDLEELKKSFKEGLKKSKIPELRQQLNELAATEKAFKKKR